MDYNWTPEKIENLKRASEYTAFHKKLSVLAEPYLDVRWSLADIGCGPGLIDFWLAPMVAGIDAIDSDETAIADLKARLDDVFLTRHDIADKITPRLMSAYDIEGEQWDVVMMNFFGLSEILLDKVLPLSKRRALIFMHGRPDTTGPLAASSDEGKFSMNDMEEYLKKRNYAYKKNVMELQFGQPFKTIEDIHAFLEKYGKQGGQEIEIVDMGGEDVFDDDAIKRMTRAEERIIKTDRFDYPYYLPKSISVALFIILTQQTVRA